MLHLIYLLAFTILAVLAISNMIRSLLTISMEAGRRYSVHGQPNAPQARPRAAYTVPHPELLDETGNVVNEPLLVMRSMTVEDARQHLDALYKSSPGGSNSETQEEA